MMHCNFDKEIMNTAYSQITLAPINTAEHFQLAAHLGFNALKGDVRITKDNKLVMCHDAGITLDENGRIGRHDKDNRLLFTNLTYDYVKSLEYAAEYDAMGHYARVCDFDTYVRICKENGKLVYITLREDKISELVFEVMKTVRKYHVENHCVINSFTIEALREVRKYSDIIPLSQVISYREPLTREVVDNVIPFKNGIVTLFFCPEKDPMKYWDASRDAIEYAKANNVTLHMAQVRSYKDYCDMVSRGVTGFHITRAFLPYTRTDIQFAVRVEGGRASFENILGSDRMAADIEQTGGEVYIRNICNVGSGYGYDDALPLLWLSKLPFDLSVNCTENSDCSITFNGKALCLNTTGRDGMYYINVNI
ncbi:MAG: hypothetical protein E7441_11415 [Ruminococcaceae bacterium]|nr:hypothetical protein [Oscillospiraceae bacterium]